MNAELFDKLGEILWSLFISMLSFLGNVLGTIDFVVSYPYRWLFNFEKPNTTFGMMLYLLGGIISYLIICSVITIGISIITQNTKKWMRRISNEKADQ